MSDATQVRITDLWNGDSKILNVKNTADFDFTIRKDKVKGGAVWQYLS